MSRVIRRRARGVPRVNSRRQAAERGAPAPAGPRAPAAGLRATRCISLLGVLLGPFGTLFKVYGVFVGSLLGPFWLFIDRFIKVLSSLGSGVGSGGSGVGFGWDNVRLLDYIRLLNKYPEEDLVKIPG